MAPVSGTVLGITVTLAASRSLLRATSGRHRIVRTVLLGVGCAIACSAKYVGFAMILPCLVVVIMAHAIKVRKKARLICMFFGVTALLVFVFNFRAFVPQNNSQSVGSVLRHVWAVARHGATAQGILANVTPNLYCIRIASRQLMFHDWIVIASSLLLCAKRAIVDIMRAYNLP